MDLSRIDPTRRQRRDTSLIGHQSADGVPSARANEHGTAVAVDQFDFSIRPLPWSHSSSPRLRSSTGPGEMTAVDAARGE